jgi:hypothetical protein
VACDLEGVFQGHIIVFGRLDIGWNLVGPIYNVGG